MRTFAALLSAALMLLLPGCGGVGAGAVSKTMNAFTRAGAPLTIDRLVADAGALGAASTQQTYYGRALVRNGGDLYGLTFRFTLNKQSNIAAYFSNFQILRLVRLNGFLNAIPLVTSATTISVPSGHNAATNNLVLVDAALRTAKFDLNFGVNLYLPNIASAGFVTADDFRTIAGGNAGSFFFIAQKATSIPRAANQDLALPFTLVDFGVNASGALNFRELWSFSSIGGAGGGGYEPFRMTTPGGGRQEGEFQLVDSESGFFVFGFDATPGDGTPTASHGLEGALLLSPDRQLLLAHDLTHAAYWAGSR